MHVDSSGHVRTRGVHINTIVLHIRIFITILSDIPVKINLDSLYRSYPLFHLLQLYTYFRVACNVKRQLILNICE